MGQLLNSALLLLFLLHPSNGFYVPFEKRPAMPWKCRIRPSLCPPLLPLPLPTNLQGLVIHEYEPLPGESPKEVERYQEWKQFLCLRFSIGCPVQDGSIPLDRNSVAETRKIGNLPSFY